MSLFTEQDVEFCKQIKESDWTPVPAVREQLREDFSEKGATTEAIENHDNWKIVRRLPTGVSKLDGSHIDDAEKLDVKYCGDKNFDKDTISTLLPAEYR